MLVSKAVSPNKLKRGIRMLIGLIGLGVVGLIWGVFSGSVQQRLTSPDNKVVAEVRQFNFRPATEAAETEVQVGSRFRPSSHTVFDGLNYGADIKISWIGSRTLLVRCGTCNSFHTVSKEERWGAILIQYEID
jgi:cytoskeletal protein RodZ